jgi:hypothetical protein
MHHRNTDNLPLEKSNLAPFELTDDALDKISGGTLYPSAPDPFWPIGYPHGQPARQ